MKRSIFAMLAILGLSLAIGALTPAAIAGAQLFPPNQNGGDNS